MILLFLKAGTMEHEGWEMGEVRGIGSVSI